MRLVSITLDGFRAFSSETHIDLDAEAVVFVGSNGSGKTSVLDGVLWALSGRVPRLGEDEASVVSLYARTGSARVVLQCRPNASSPILTITRTLSGTESSLTVTSGDTTLHGPSAEGFVLQAFWPDAATAAKPIDSFASLLTRLIYLQQDLVRNFVDSVRPQDRFEAISELFGAGKVSDLQHALEREKTAWTTTTNAQRGALDPTRKQIAAMEFRLNQLTSRRTQGGNQVSEAEWNQWWTNVQRVAGLPEAGYPNDPAEALDLGLRQLGSQIRTYERRLEALGALRSSIAELRPEPEIKLATLQARVLFLKSEFEAANAAYESEGLRIVDERRRQTLEADALEQLRTLAELALRHLGPRCPVCSQDYDVAATRHRLEEIVAQARREPIHPHDSELFARLATTAGEKELALRAAERELQLRESADAKQSALQDSISRQLNDLGIAQTADSPGQAVEMAFSACQSTLEELRALRASGELLAVRTSELSNLRSIEDLRQEISKGLSALEDAQKAIAARDRVGETAQEIILGLREASTAMITRQVKLLEPLLQDIYDRMSPHPSLRVISLVTEMFRGQGHLNAVLRDPEREIESASPAVVLSSSQMNVVALSAFLAINLSLASPPLSTVVLDDPLQSLDDVNLLGLMELLRRIKGTRQLLVSTHDQRFGALLERKLRPSFSGGRSLVVEFDDWGREGPVLATREVLRDSLQLRLVAS